MRLNNASKFKPVYDNQSQWARINSQPPILNSILNPFTFYYGAHNWSNNSSYELWNKGNTSTNINNGDSHKTIYDPSPSFFHIPISAAFTGLTLTGNNSNKYNELNVSGTWNNGWTFFCYPNKTGNTFYAAALGIRVYDSGILGEYNDTGHAWTSIPANNSYAWVLMFRSYDVNTQYQDPRGYGFPCLITK